MFAIIWHKSPLRLLSLTVLPFMLVVFRRYAQPMLEREYERQEVEADSTPRRVNPFLGPRGAELHVGGREPELRLHAERAIFRDHFPGSADR